MCEKAVDRYPFALEWVPDWFATPKILKDLDRNDLDNIEFDKLTTWYNQYKQREVYRKGADNELMAIA